MVACIEDPVVIKQILDHLERRARQLPAISLARAPPEGVCGELLFMLLRVVGIVRGNEISTGIG